MRGVIGNADNGRLVIGKSVFYLSLINVIYYNGVVVQVGNRQKRSIRESLFSTKSMYRTLSSGCCRPTSQFQE